MKLSALLLLAAVSTGLSAHTWASTRPHYGGTLRVAVRSAHMPLDPADSSQPDSPAARSLSHLMFDTLVILDARGQPQPALATSWRAEPGNQRWQFSIRRGVTYQDGTVVGPDAVAASLRRGDPTWKVMATNDAVVIECSLPTPNLPAVLALTRYGIAKRSAGKVTGSGPFAISSWDPDKKLSLKARDDYWGGRAFLDAIEVEFGKSFRELMIMLDLGKAEVVEVPPDQLRLATVQGRRVESSAPAELMALVFRHDRSTADVDAALDGKLRRAFSLSIDRNSINNVLLQGGSVPTGALLPDWMTGYAFVFPTSSDMLQAQLLRGEVPQAPAWTLGYDASDSLEKVIGERIALNASEAGLRLQPTNSGVSDVRLVRVPLATTDGRIALSSLATRLELPVPKFSDDSAYSLYVAENTLLQSQRAIPLLYLRNVVGLSPQVRGWAEDPDGEWRLENVWIEVEKP